MTFDSKRGTFAKFNYGGNISDVKCSVLLLYIALLEM